MKFSGNYINMLRLFECIYLIIYQSKISTTFANGTPSLHAFIILNFTFTSFNALTFLSATVNFNGKYALK